MAGIVENLFQKSIKSVDGGEELLKSLDAEEKFGLRRYAGVNGNVRGVVNWALKDGLQVEVKKSFQRSEGMHNGGFSDFYALALKPTESIDLMGYSPDQLTIKEGNGPVHGSRIFHKDDLLAVVEHRGDLEIISHGGGENSIMINPFSI